MQEHGLVEKDFSLFYRIVGKGEPVMLVHGFGEDSNIWETLEPALRENYRLIIPDLPGSGKSTCNIEGITIELLADHLHAILEKEQITSCAMIGHSMGGYITLAFAEKFPERLSRFGLFHSTAYPDSDEKKDTRRKNMEFIRKHGSEKFIQQTVPNLFSESFRKEHPEKVENIVHRYSNFSPTSLVSYTAAMMNRPDRTSVLKSFGKPVLFIMGEYDNAVPIEQGLQQCSIPEFSYIYIAAHSGHMGMIEEPEFCLKAIQEFLSGE